MIVNHTIRYKWHEGYVRNPRDIHQIVLHGTGGGSSAAGLIKWMEDGERSESYLKAIGLFHYLIDFDGQVIEIIDPEKWVYHSSSGRHDKETLGIELMNSESKNTGDYNLGQYKALVDLFDILYDKYTVSSIIGHGACKMIYSGSYKECPGNFEWEILTDEMISRGYTFTYSEEKINGIKKES